MDRAGLFGEDGQTQHGVFDIAFMRMLPNMKVMAPKDEEELRHMLYTAIRMDGPVALRYPRGKALGVPMTNELHQLPVGKAELLQRGDHRVVQPALADDADIVVAPPG